MTRSKTLQTNNWLDIFFYVLAMAMMISAQSARADDLHDSILDIQHRWAEANYQESGKSQKKAFAALLDDARKLEAANPSDARAYVWHGIVASTYAGVKGPFGAMSLAKEARDALLEAESLDPAALEGSVYTSLGTLYYKVPGGLIGFGDKDLARKYLDLALDANPDGIDPNYFMGEFLYAQKDFAAARLSLLKAQRATSRPERPLADEGRRAEIAALLTKVNEKLNTPT